MSDPVPDLSTRLEAIDAALTDHWREVMESGDVELGTVLAETVRHLRHARLALARRAIG